MMHKKLKSASTLLFSASLLAPFAAQAETADNFMTALTSGKASFDARYRYEYVDQTGLANHANASTLRTKLGYTSGVFMGFKAGIEFENITTVGGEKFNDTINGKATYPVVADPEDTVLNQAYISWQGIKGATATIGRQVIKLDNERFVGPVAWRQNDQTFDAGTITVKSIPNLSLFYGYVTQVNRVFGPRSPASPWSGNHIHLLNASYQLADALKVTGYGYFLDIPEALASSSQTLGVRLEGALPAGNGLKATYAAEYAHQKDYKDNPASFGLDYYLVQPGIAWNGLALQLGYERLSGDGVSAFQTPLATLHAFNGWADKFLTTPANGLIDKYTSLSYALPASAAIFQGTTLTVAYHDFNASKGGANYGTEWDAMVSKTFLNHYSVAVKFADYRTQTFATDTRKLMVMAGVKF